MKVAIIGAGAIGGYVGVKVALAGDDVTFIVRGANLEAIRRNGMKLVMSDGTEHVAHDVATTNVAGLFDVGGPMPRAQADAVAPQRLRQRADQAAARLRRDEQGVRRRRVLRQHDRAVADRRRAVSARAEAAALDQLRAGGPARMDAARRARRVRRGPDAAGRRTVRRL